MIHGSSERSSSEIGPDRDHPPLPQHRDAVADRVEAVEIVGDHEDGEAERVLQGGDQIVELARADRVEARGRLVEEQQIGVERQRARQRRPLDHAARQLGGIFVGGVLRQADQRDLQHRQFVAQPRRQVEMLAHRRLDVLPDRQAGEQRALLEQHAPALADAAALGGGEAVDVVAVDFDRPGLLGQKPEHGAGEDRLARARGADQAEHFAAADVDVEPIHHQMVAEADLQPAHADDDLAGARAFVEVSRRRRGGVGLGLGQ